MKSIKVLSWLPLLCLLLLIGGCANAPSESIDKSVIGTSEPEKEQHPVLLDEISDTDLDGASAPAAIEENTLRNKSEKTGDDMERLD